jgi:dihydroneopterin aldolase
VSLARIGLSGLRVRCVIGAWEAERRQEQEIRMDVELWRDVRAAASSDQVRDTTNYDTVAAVLAAVARDGRFHLLEALATAGARALLQQCPDVDIVMLRVTKPGAVPLADGAWVEVEERRGE